MQNIQPKCIILDRCHLPEIKFDRISISLFHIIAAKKIDMYLDIKMFFITHVVYSLRL